MKEEMAPFYQDSRGDAAVQGRGRRPLLSSTPAGRMTSNALGGRVMEQGVPPLLLFAVMAAMLFAVVAAMLLVFHFKDADSLLRGWAKRNGFRLVRQEHRSFLKGPFFWTSSDGQAVYYVTVEDKNGVRRSGWVRCGGWFLGLFSDKVKVRWDDSAG